MSLADCLTALRFLTRLPVPGKAAAEPGDLAPAAAWFPLAGVIVGLTVAGALWAGAHASPSIGALLALLVWVGITGGYEPRRADKFAAVALHVAKAIAKGRHTQVIINLLFAYMVNKCADYGFKLLDCIHHAAPIVYNKKYVNHC